MYILTIVLTVLISILLIIVVLIQKSKGGGLSSSFAGSNQIMGVRRTNDFIEKATWTLAGIICLLSILSVFVMPSVVTGARVKPTTEMQVIKGTETSAPAPAAAPVAAPEADATEMPAAPAAE
ncbi:MAG: preprotein translocase subunit SecG [Muribaculaceae bacterium]|nr:preprotein translocase subunit SecG [Muribaculaceae bacterium]